MQYIVPLGWERLLRCSKSSGLRRLCYRDRSHLCPAGLVRKKQKISVMNMLNVKYVSRNRIIAQLPVKPPVLAKIYTQTLSEVNPSVKFKISYQRSKNSPILKALLCLNLFQHGRIQGGQAERDHSPCRCHHHMHR